MNIASLSELYKQHMQKEEKIWEILESQLTEKYIKEGYWRLFAEEKARQETLELRSLPKKTHPMPSRVPADYYMGE